MRGRAPGSTGTAKVSPHATHRRVATAWCSRASCRPGRAWTPRHWLL